MICLYLDIGLDFWQEFWYNSGYPRLTLDIVRPAAFRRHSVNSLQAADQALSVVGEKWHPLQESITRVGVSEKPTAKVLFRSRPRRGPAVLKSQK